MIRADERRAYAWMALSATLFATMNFFARAASTHAAWTQVAAVRAIVGLLVALAVARVRHQHLELKHKRLMWLRSALGTAAMGCTFVTLSRPSLPLGDIVTLLNLGPVFLAALSPFVLGERSGRRILVALPLSMAGVVMVVRPALLFGGDRAQPGAGLTAGLAVTAAVFTAFAMMALRRIGQRESAEAIAVHFSAVASVVFGFAGAIELVDRPLPGLVDLGAMIAAGVCAGFGQLAMTRAYALGEAARVAAMGYLAVIVSALLGAVALAEVPRPMAWVGMGLVILGGLAVALPGALSGTPPGTPPGTIQVRSQVRSRVRSQVPRK